MSHEAVWQHVLEHIRRSITEVEFHTWFERIRPLGIRDGVLELAVPTSFALDWIRRHYAGLIQEALGLLGAQAPRFELRVVPGVVVQEDIFQAAPAEAPGPSSTRSTPLKTSWWGPTTPWPTPPPWPWPSPPAGPTTPSSSTGAWAWERPT